VCSVSLGGPSDGAFAGDWAITVPSSVRILIAAWSALSAKSLSDGSTLSGYTVIPSVEGSCSAVSSTWRLKSERRRSTVSEPIASAKAHRITNVSSAETPASRTRMGSRSKLLDRRALTRRSAAETLSAKDVAGSPDGVQEAGFAVGLQLAAQVGYEHLDGVRGRERVIAPHLVEQALA